MATPEQVRAMVRAVPFQPFRVKLAGGQAFTVRHPENIACDVRGRDMTLYDDDGMHLLEMLLVELIEPMPSAPAPDDSGEGT
jgi:hypothetical protein